MRVGPVVGVCALLVLVGCSGGTFNGVNQGAATASVAGVGFSGTVHGGQQPISGAHVYLLAANTTGYGGAGIAASSSNASVSLLTSGYAQDTNNNWYVQTGSDGSFSISGDYSCTTGQQVYLYATGGNAGSGANSAAGLMAVLGNCPGGSSAFASSTPYVLVNEVSTVAAAYALAGFATDATHVSSSGTALAQVGIANAFANAANLETLSTGVALATTPAGWNVPQTEINTLANVLAACVNSNGAVTNSPSATPCYTLLTGALSGGATGAQPVDTATAAINIAHNPGVNVASLYGLASATPPFAPALTAVPNDWMMPLVFAGGGMDEPQGIAIDATGNAWVANMSNNSVTKLSKSGLILSGAGGFTTGYDTEPTGVAIDGAGNAWISSGEAEPYEINSSGTLIRFLGGYTYSGGSSGVAIDGSGNAWFAELNILAEFSSSGSPVSGTTPYSNHGLDTVSNGLAIAVDGSGSAWAESSASVATVVSSSGSYLSGANGYAVSACCAHFGGTALDASGDAWFVNSAHSAVFKLSNSGTLVSGSSGYTGGGISAPLALAIDGAGMVWVLGDGLTELSNTGAIVSGANALSDGASNYATALAIDGSGDIWVTNSMVVDQSGTVAELIGAAAPVITPIAAGLPAAPTANGSSNLGTRP